MKLAICNETYRDWPFDQACSHAYEHGYRGLEVAPFTLGGDATEVDSSARAGFRKLVEESGLTIIGLHWLLAHTTGYHLTSPDKTTRIKTTDYLKALAHLCSDLGGSWMVFGSPAQRSAPADVPVQDALGFAESVVADVLPTLEQTGIQLLMEPLGPRETNFLNTAQETIEFCQRFQSEYVKLHLADKAMSTEEKPIPQIIRESSDWLVHFHANDPNLRGPGMGDVQFEPILAALDQINYPGWISVEVFDQECSVESLVEESSAYLLGMARQQASSA